MNTEKKIKLFIQGMSRYFKKLPFVRNSNELF